jgi:hypothetical protein
MNKIFKLLFFSSLVFCATFFIGSNALADLAYDIVHYDDSTVSGTGRQNMAFNFFPTVDNISGIYLPDVAGNPTTQFFICKGTMSYEQFNTMWSDQGGAAMTSCGTYDQIGSVLAEPTLGFYDFGEQFTLIPNDEYFIIFYQTDSAAGISTSISYNKYGDTYLYGDTFNYIPYYDARFSTAYDGYPPSDEWSITQIYPYDSVIVPSTIVPIHIEFTIPEGYSGSPVFYLYYPNDSAVHTLYGYGEFTATTTGSFTVEKALVDGAYLLTSHLLDFNTNEDMASTSIVAFGVKRLASLSFDLPFGLSEDNVCNGIATTTSYTNLHFLGDLECAGKKLLVWALNPSTDSLDLLAKSADDIKTKFPFSAYFQLTTIVSDSIATTTTGMSGGLGMPFIDTGGDFTILPIISSTTLPNAIGEANTGLFRSTIQWIMWLSVAILIYIQVRPKKL